MKHTLQLAPYKKATRLAYYIGLEKEDVVNGDIFFCTTDKVILFIEVMITNDKPAAEHACTWEIWRSLSLIRGGTSVNTPEMFSCVNK